VDVGDAVTVGGGVRVAGWVGGKPKVGVPGAGGIAPCNAGISKQANRKKETIIRREYFFMFLTCHTKRPAGFLAKIGHTCGTLSIVYDFTSTSAS
jgi:hypothetical protein